MSNYYSICKAFVAGEQIKKSWLGRVRESEAWASRGPLYSEPGTIRLNVVNHDGTAVLMSYGHFALAVRTSDGQIIVNGDNAPTVTSRKQQRELRSALGTTTACLLPFSALQAARIRPDDVVIVATTPDKEIETWKKCRCEKSWHQKENVYKPSDFRFHDDGSHDVKITQHFLGETLFSLKHRQDRFYVSGLDRNDDPSKRHFYLAQLPEGVAPKTVDEALETLKPEGLTADGWYRQGEWFFVPTPGLKPVIEGENVLVKETSIGYKGMRRGVPIVTDQAESMRSLVPDGWDIRMRAHRHRAPRMYINGSVYVSGMVRDAEHNPLKLGDGKAWYRVVRNRAAGSWGAGGQVD